MVSVLRHVNVLHDEMDADEVELLWIRALRIERAHQGALMLTDRNIRWSGMGGLTQSQDAFPLARLRDVQVAPARKGQVLHLDIGGVRHEFGARQADLDLFVPRVETQRAQVPLEEEVAAGPDLLEELERLAHLHASGALTQSEFESAKRQLLA